MDKLNRLRRAQRRIVKVQRRVWLAQALIWPTLIAAVSASGALLYLLWRRSPGGRHVLPPTPGVHETGTLHVEPDGRLSAAEA
ncbi:hypothetical protein [Mycobacterium sp. JS623]|uniref:hypothetical protein n=1 Tax=Mycobacterium sp. JS623 TaxID=212767 RepID=UPI000301FA98|nr:hypothetical protein [Mycobacterium sp. JS623]